MAKKVIVAGGGLAGLSSAIRLANGGFHVSLFEQNPQLGGKMNERRLNGYRFDTGPSLLTMPFVLEELFQSIGEELSERINYIPVEPLCHYRFPDGTHLDASADQIKMVDEIARIAPDDVPAYPRFLDYSRRIFELTADLFLWNPIHELAVSHLPLYLRSLFRLHRIDPFRTVHRAVASYFRDPRLIQLFDRYATYNGSSPYQAPATLNIIPFVEFGLGGYYILGGLYRLVEVLERLAVSLGVEIHRSAPVEKILHKRGAITGVRVDGATYGADYVICNVDIVTAYHQLLDNLPHRRQRVTALEPSMSGLVFLWGKRGLTQQLHHHNILFSGDYRREFHQLFDELQAPDDPTVYIAITSKTDPGDAPAGHENWFVLVNMPYLNDQQDWPEIVQETRNRIFEKLKTHGIDIAGKIETERLITPPDFMRMYGSNLGSIYGIASNSRHAAFRRHPNRSRDIKGLYFAGGSVHPGGGIPLVLLSGRIAATLIAEREGISGGNRGTRRDELSLRGMAEEWIIKHQKQTNNSAYKRG
ncbi:MAG: phytoene desaturase family protein [Calditrichota bacterium]